MPIDRSDSPSPTPVTGAAVAGAPAAGLRALVTGYGGFAGGHLADELLRETDWQLWGTLRGPDEVEDRSQLPDPDARIPSLESPIAPAAEFDRLADSVVGTDMRRTGSVRTLHLDLRDPEALRRAIDHIEPDIVFHLAGQASVSASWRDPWATFEANLRMQINLQTALAGSGARLLAVTSNEIFGAPDPEYLPTNEEAPLAPMNPYAASKAAQDLAAAQAGRSGDLAVIRLRPFNHIGPGQDAGFVLPAFAKQIAEIESGLRPARLEVGNLAAERDFSDVRDIVRGYRLAAEKGQAGEAYNLGSGVARSIQSLVDLLLDRADRDIEVIRDPERMRPNDIPRSCCDASKALDAFGWATRIDFESSVESVLDEWRVRLRAATTLT